MGRNSSDPLEPHSHDPNPSPPSDDPTLTLALPDGQEVQLNPQTIQHLSRTTLMNCYIVSTGHGTSGPFSFSGVSLIHLISSYIPESLDWNQVEVISGDGFGTRILKQELSSQEQIKPTIVADTLDSRPMTREEGLIRLIVPAEKDDALRQVKWISRIIVRKSN